MDYNSNLYFIFLFFLVFYFFYPFTLSSSRVRLDELFFWFRSGILAMLKVGSDVVSMLSLA